MQITIPANTGFHVEYNGNITGAFDRAKADMLCNVEYDNGSYYIVQLPIDYKYGKRARVIKSLCREVD